MKKLFFILALIANNSADLRHIQDFSLSVEQELGFNMDRFRDVSEKIKFAKPSKLAQWGIINSYAEATYNDILNVIELKEENFVFSNHQGRVRTIAEMKEIAAHAFSVKMDNLFHEMAHAEMDVMIEEGFAAPDKKLYTILKEEVKPWFEKHFPDRNSKLAIFELHGYYVGQIIEVLYADRGDIFLQNGINEFNKTIFKSFLAKSKLSSLSLEEYCELLTSEEDSKIDLSYAKRLPAPMIWVKGKDIDIASVKGKDAFQQKWLDALWEHFSTLYNPPQTKREWTQRLKTRNPLDQLMKEKRKQFWQEAHTKKEEQSNPSSFDGLENSR